MRIDQWVPTLHRGDAIGDSARLMRDAFRRWGHEADVYALEMDDELEGDGRRFADFRPGAPSDVVILHFALPSPLTQALAAQRGRRVLLYHNITPPEFFAAFDEEMVRICRIGREELLSLRHSVDLALADSEFNRRELEQAGFAQTGVLPIFLDFARYGERPNPVTLRRLGGGTINVLFVGRLAPNKRQDDLIRVYTYWRRFITPDVRLVLVGKPPRQRSYVDALQRLFYDNGLTADEVLLLGHVDHDDLLACYRSAHVYLSMSEHEGFGVPLVEAMLLDVPILAYRATAVADTLGDAGVQFTERRIDEIAEMGHLLATDARLRAAVLAGQRRRVAAFAPATVEAALRGYVDSLAAG